MAISRTSGSAEEGDGGGTLSKDLVFTMLSNGRRRHVIHYLKQRGERVTIRELSRQVAAWENGIETDALDYKQRKRVYTSLHQTHLPKLDDLGVSVLEQPLSADSLDAHARLRGRGVDIALDEGLAEHGFDAAIGADAADILVCKPMALGGIDTVRNVVRSARTAGIDAVITTTIDGAVARAGAVHLAASLPELQPCGLGTGDLLGSDLRVGVAPVAKGSAAVPQGKGNIPPG